MLIVHIVGHGELAEGSSEKLYILDHDGERLTPAVGGWIDLIEDYPRKHRPVTLFVLDVCYAGHAAVESWHARMDVGQRRAWVLAATGPGQKAFGYRLSRALVQVLNTYRALDVRFDPSLQYIPSRTVWRDVERRVEELSVQAHGLPQKILTSLVPGHTDLAHLPFFPNPSYRPGRGHPAATRSLPPEVARLADWAVDPMHFMRRAGAAEAVHRDWTDGYFSGRAPQLRTFSCWLDDTTTGPGVRVITGKPGVGKSAVLGILVCAAHPALRRHTRPLWSGLGSAAPGENERIAVIHARRLTLDDIVASLARQLRDMSAPDVDSGIGTEIRDITENPADYLMARLPGDRGHVTVVLDALDEAQRPGDISAALLEPLARYALSPGSRLRLLVGTRDDERVHNLLALAQGANGHTDLSAIPPDQVCEDLVAYVERLLEASNSYAAGTLRTVRKALAVAIAETLTQRGATGDAVALEWGEFLTAGLYVHYLLNLSQPPTSPEKAARLGRAVPRSLPALLELDLERNAGQLLLRPVLTALAFAQGRGMPEGVLAHAASAFTTADDSPLPLLDLYALLGGEARFYLHRDIDEDGTTLYRLFHEELASWLRTSRIQPQHQDSHTTVAQSPDSAERLYQRLMSCVPRDVAGRTQWHLVAPYLLRHMAQHALDAGCVDALLEDASCLQYCDPHSLANVLTHVRSDQARLNAAIYRVSSGVHHRLSPTERGQILALDAARFGEEPLRRKLLSGSGWRVLWATGNQVSTALIRTIMTDASSVVMAKVHGRPHAVAPSNNHSVGVWDLATGAQTHTLTGHTDVVIGVAVVELKGRPHAVTASYDESVRVWDLATGNQAATLTGHTDGIRSMKVAELNGRPHAVTSSHDDSIRVWDLTAGTHIRTLVGATQEALVLAVVELDGRPYAITTSLNGPVRLWDLTAGTETSTLFDQTCGVHSLEVAELNGRPYAVTASHGEPVQVWDLNTGAHFRTLASEGRTGESVVAVAEIDARPLVITTGDDNAARIWDLTTGTLTHTLTGHTHVVGAAAVTDLDGRPHAVTASYDGSVRVWDLAPGSEKQTSYGRILSMGLLSVAELEGKPHVVTAGRSGSVRVWNMVTGTESFQLTGHSDEVRAVAVTELDGRPHAITGSADGSVRVWNMVTGTESFQLTGHSDEVRAVAVTELDGRPHAITGSADGSVRVWNMVTGTESFQLTGHTGMIHSLAVIELSERPHVVSTSRDESIRVWDLATGTQAYELAGRVNWIHAVAVAEVGGEPHAVIASVDKTVRVWGLTTGAYFYSLTGHTDRVTAVATARVDGHVHVVTGSADGSIRVWDLTAHTHLAKYRLPAMVSAVSVTSDATVIVAFSREVVVLNYRRD
ncbi:hypothetical protein OG937_02855 [Streptomyces sp. NBC_00510]